VSFLGRDITSLTPEKRAHLGLVRSFQSSALFPTMTVRETVMVACEREDPSHIGASIIGWPRAERAKRARADDLLDVMGLGAIARRAVGELSTGTRRMVELTCMLALEPRLLLLDEPAGGLAQSEGDKLVELVTAIRRDLNATVVVVEHDLPLLFRMAERMVAMELGQVIAVGTPQEVRNHPEVVRSYLGGEVAAVERSGAFPVAAEAAVLG
jgi:ABC-type branched-subunit amino acid transport system ATPase component